MKYSLLRVDNDIINLVPEEIPYFYDEQTSLFIM